MQYEYMVISIREIHQGEIIVERVNGEKPEWSGHLVPLHEFLNVKGKEGWEALAVFDMRESARGHSMVLKRVI